MKKSLSTIFLILFCVAFVFGQNQGQKAEQEIVEQMKTLREAHLTSDSELAHDVFDKKLILTSQSGKIYKKKDVLKNIENKFESYENSGIRFLHLSKEIVIVNFINERKFAGFVKGKFRVTAVWLKSGNVWRIISMQSSKIKEPKS